MEKNESNKKNKRDFTKTRNITATIYFLLGILFLLVFFGAFEFLDDIAPEILYPTEIVYDFEDDVIGEHPEGWSGLSWSGTEVIAWEKDETHGQVAQIENRDGRGVETATRFKKAERGVIEFEIYCDFDEVVSIDITQLTEDHDIVDDIIIHLGGSDSDIKIKDGNNNFAKVQSFSVDRWYHFEIKFNMDYWELWIDGEHILLYQGYYINYYEEPSYFCQLYFSTYVDNNRFYIDNVEIVVIETT